MLGSGLLKGIQTKLFPRILQKVLWQLLRYTIHHALDQECGVYSYICSVKFPGSMSFVDTPLGMGARVVTSESQDIKNFW